jgi:hypothetical protein
MTRSSGQATTPLVTTTDSLYQVSPWRRHIQAVKQPAPIISQSNNRLHSNLTQAAPRTDSDEASRTVRYNGLDVSG